MTQQQKRDQKEVTLSLAEEVRRRLLSVKNTRRPELTKNKQAEGSETHESGSSDAAPALCCVRSCIPALREPRAAGALPQPDSVLHPRLVGRRHRLRRHVQGVLREHRSPHLARAQINWMNNHPDCCASGVAAARDPRALCSSPAATLRLAPRARRIRLARTWLPCPAAREKGRVCVCV